MSRGPSQAKAVQREAWRMKNRLYRRTKLALAKAAYLKPALSLVDSNTLERMDKAIADIEAKKWASKSAQKAHKWT